MPTTDLGPAAARMAGVLAGIADDQLAGPTPCPKYAVGDLVEHVGGLTLAFTDAATKAPAGPDGPGSQLGDATRLPASWRTSIPAALDGLVAAWRDDSAWQGMTQAGGVELPGEVAGLVALEEIVVHGWDLAVATGQPYEVDRPTLEVLAALLPDFAPAQDPDDPVVNDGTLAYGPAVEVPASAPLLDRVIGLAGRHPGWTPDGA